MVGHVTVLHSLTNVPSPIKTNFSIKILTISLQYDTSRGVGIIIWFWWCPQLRIIWQNFSSCHPDLCSIGIHVMGSNPVDAGVEQRTNFINFLKKKKDQYILAGHLQCRRYTIPTWISWTSHICRVNSQGRSCWHTSIKEACLYWSKASW